MTITEKEMREAARVQATDNVCLDLTPQQIHSIGALIDHARDEYLNATAKRQEAFERYVELRACEAERFLNDTCRRQVEPPL